MVIISHFFVILPALPSSLNFHCSSLTAPYPVIMSPQKYFKRLQRFPGLASCLSPLLSTTITYPPKDRPRMRCNSELPLKRPPAPHHYVLHEFTRRSKTPNYTWTPRCLSPRAVHSKLDPIFCSPLTTPPPPNPYATSSETHGLLSPKATWPLLWMFPSPFVSALSRGLCFSAVTLTGDTSPFHRAIVAGFLHHSAVPLPGYSYFLPQTLLWGTGHHRVPPNTAPHSSRGSPGTAPLPTHGIFSCQAYCHCLPAPSLLLMTLISTWTIPPTQLLDPLPSNEWSSFLFLLYHHCHGHTPVLVLTSNSIAFLLTSVFPSHSSISASMSLQLCWGLLTPFLCPSPASCSTFLITHFRFQDL